jgi:hypothetical protein
MKKTLTPFAARFWAKVQRAGPDDCWNWIGARKNNGYGHLSRGRADEGHVHAHRASYELNVDPVPPTSASSTAATIDVE